MARAPLEPADDLAPGPAADEVADEGGHAVAGEGAREGDEALGDAGETFASEALADDVEEALRRGGLGGWVGGAVHRVERSAE